MLLFLGSAKPRIITQAAVLARNPRPRGSLHGSGNLAVICKLTGSVSAFTREAQRGKESCPGSYCPWLVKPPTFKFKLV